MMDLLMKNKDTITLYSKNKDQETNPFIYLVSLLNIYCVGVLPLPIEGEQLVAALCCCSLLLHVCTWQK